MKGERCCCRQKYEDITSVEIDGDPMSRTSFGDTIAEPSAPAKCGRDALIDQGTYAKTVFL